MAVLNIYRSSKGAGNLFVSFYKNKKTAAMAARKLKAKGRHQFMAQKLATPGITKRVFSVVKKVNTGRFGNVTSGMRRLGKGLHT